MRQKNYKVGQLKNYKVGQKKLQSETGITKWGKKITKWGVTRVFNLAIWWLQNISRVSNFAILVRIRNGNLIKYQFPCLLINVIVIKYVTETLTSWLQVYICDIRVSISYSHQILRKDNLKLGSDLISWVFNFTTFWFWNFSRVQNFTKMIKNCENREI